MIVYDLVGVCDACADGVHVACVRRWHAVDGGAYAGGDFIPTPDCGCTICWGGRSS